MLKQNSWQEVVFEDICENVSLRVTDPKNSGYKKYVGLEHLDTLESKIMRYGSTQDVTSTMTLFKRGNILFGKRNWYLRRVAVSDFDGVCSADIYVLDAKEGKIMRDFLPIFMHSDQFFEKTLKYSTGSMSTRVKWSNLSKIKFVIPLIPEQEKIVNLISNIDHSLSTTLDLFEKLNNYKRFKTNELLTKGIDHKKFKKLFIIPKFIDFIIPDQWKVKKLYEISIEIKDGPMGFGLHTSDYKKEGIPILRIQNLKDSVVTKDDLKYISEKKHNELKKSKVNPLDIIISKTGILGMIGVVPEDYGPANLNQALARITLKDKDMIPYVVAFLSSKIPQQILNIVGSGRTVQPGLKLSDLKNLDIPIPPLEEQQKIISMLSIMNNQTKQLEKHLFNLKSMKKSILNEKLIPLKMEVKIV